MKVYTAESHVDYEGFRLIGIYDDIEKAKKACEEHEEDSKKYGFQGWYTYEQNSFEINETDI